MREQFHDELRAVTDSLLEMTTIVSTAVRNATTALVEADLALAESVIAADERLDQLQLDLEQRTVTLLARQQPVATDLRVIVTSFKITMELERMGKLARHLAKLARRRYPAHVVPDELTGTMVEMGRVADLLVTELRTVLETRDVDLAEKMERDDDEMDRLHRHLFDVILAPGWSYGVEAAVDVTLCGRFYERFADHAVTVGRRVVYLVTGEHLADDVG